jgi:FkbM family methyltransferase
VSEPFGHFRDTWVQRAVFLVGRQLPENWLGKRIAAFLRTIVRRTRSPVDVERLGSKMRINLNDNASERRLMVTPQFFDPHDLAILRSHIRPGFSFVDLGANVGTYSLFVARHAGPGASIVAIEPYPPTAERLRDNIRFNGFPIVVEQSAIADDEGEVTLNIDTNNLGATSLAKQLNVRGAHQSVTVPAMPLHKVIEKHGLTKIDALKADIEGFEDRAILSLLRSTQESLWPRIIVVEDNHKLWREDLVVELEKRGWQMTSVGSANMIFIRNSGT